MKTMQLPVVPPQPATEPTDGKPADGSPSAGGECRVYVETYGCQMNVADTELMRGILRDSGFATVAEPGNADVILVNTCAVRGNAEERVFGRLGELTRFKRSRPRLVLGVTGCMAEHLKEDIPARARSVDLVVGPDGYRRLPELIARALDENAGDPALEVRLDRGENYVGVDPVRRDTATGWVTIMRGCDRFCTFCIVPYTRGREKSVEPEEVLRHVRRLAEAGYREVCLLGQTVNSYRHGGTDFSDLLRLVSEVDGIERIRFASPHPADFTPKLIETIGEVETVCPYVHLPLQSGANTVLKRMRRDYTVEQYLRAVADLRRAKPGMALSTDIITGFCGETNEEFEATVRLMEAVRFDFAFLFKYSARAGTAAHRTMRDDVPEEEKGERLRRVIDLQERIAGERNAERIGDATEILVEGPAKKSPGHVFGRTPEFKSLIVPGFWKKNTLLPVRVTGSSPHTLFGVAVGAGT